MHLELSTVSAWIRRGTIATAVALAACGNAHALPVVYDNGAPGSGLGGIGFGTGFYNGGSMSSAFTLTKAETITAAAFSYWITPGVLPAAVSWKIGTSFEDGSLALGSGGSAALVQAGSSSSFHDLYTITIDFSDIALNAGTYYLTLSSSTQDVGYWVGASFTGGNTQIRTPTSVTQVPYRYAFQIFGIEQNVPEPGSLALLGLGLVGLAATRKRKQA